MFSIFSYSITVYMATQKCPLAIVFTNKSDIFLKGNITLYHITKISIFLVALENTVFVRGSER